MSDRRIFWLAFLGLAFTNLFWAINATLARGYTADIAPIAMNLFRWLGAFVILTPFALRPVIGNWGIIRPKLFPLTVLAAFSITLYNSLLYLAAGFTTTVNITLINTLIPVVTLLVAWRVLGNRPRLVQSLGMLISMLGVLLILTRGSLGQLLAVGLSAGDLIMLGAVVSWAVYTVLLKRIDIQLSPLALLYLLILLGLPLLMVAYAIEAWLFRFYWPPIAHLGLFSYLWIFPSIIAYMFWMQGVRHVGAEGAALSINLMPIFGATLAISFLGESVHWYHLAGGFCSLCGMVLALRPPCWAVRILGKKPY